MKTIKPITHALAGLITLTLVAGCSSDNDSLWSDPTDSRELHTCEMILIGGLSDFGDEPHSRAATGWSNGDKIYLTFTGTSGSTSGDAVYKDGSWTVSYYGSLYTGSSAKCTAAYFENPDYVSGTVVSLTPNSGIYEDTNGSYILNNGKLSVTATLKPKTGRIRFTSATSGDLTVSGISHFTSYDASTGRFATSDCALKATVKGGTTDYIYGLFADTSAPRFNLLTPASAFTCFPSSAIFQPGQSGYMTVPTPQAYNGWVNAAIFKVAGVEFTMIPVDYQSGYFLLAETETTDELYSAVLGNKTSSQKPKYGLGGNTWLTFLGKLNDLTGLNFRVPEYNEWKYAFLGGNKSKGYKYSGSNILSAVGWYDNNSNGNIHDVKQLQPNELGFYDMSGNVFEYVTASSYNFYGGCYSSSESQCSYDSGTSIYYSAGLRIAL